MQNIKDSVLHAIQRTPWYAKRRSYRVLFWREIIPLAVPIFFENLCVLLMGVLSTFLVSWLGKEAMAGVGLADSFNMVIIAFFAAVDLRTTVVVAFSLGKRNPERARAAARQSLALMTVLSVLMTIVIQFYGHHIINVIAGNATPEVKALALSYLHISVWSYPAAAIALIGSGAAAVIYVLMTGFNPALKISLKSYFSRLNTNILMEVLGIGIPASIESVLFNSGKLLTQVFVAGMGTNVIAGNFIAFSIVSLINLPGNALGSASTIIVGTRLGKRQISQAERQLKHIFWLSTLGLCALALLSAPFAGLLAAFYTNERTLFRW